MITHELLHDKVVRDIALKVLMGGEKRLPNEADLCKELTVSRTILRESIKVLAAKGLIKVGHGGTVARPREDWNVLDSQLLEWISQNGNSWNLFDNLLELRQAFEPKAAELAARRATQADTKAIQAALDEMRLAKDGKAYTSADLHFHECIFKATHNELFCQIGGFTKIFLRMLFSLTAGSGPSSPDSVSVHNNVLQAIVKGDVHAARKHMEEVLRLSARTVLKMNKAKARKRGALARQNGHTSTSPKRG